jgi:hypothetical protein
MYKVYPKSILLIIIGITGNYNHIPLGFIHVKNPKSEITHEFGVIANSINYFASTG